MKFKYGEKIIKIDVIFFIICVSILSIMSILFLTCENVFNLKISNILVVCTFIIGGLLWNILNYRRNTGSIINYFLLVLFIFLGSHHILSLTGVKSKGILTNVYVADVEQYRANLLICIGALTFIMGAISFKSQVKVNKRKISVLLNLGMNSYGDIIGYALLVIGVTTFLLDFDKSLFQMSYSQFENKSNLKLIWEIVLPLCGYILCISNKNTSKKIGVATLISISIMYLLLGNRGYAISNILIFVWLYNIRVSKIDIVKTIIISISLLFIINIFYELKPYTLAEKLDPTTYKNIELNPLTSILEEGSITYRSVVYTLAYIPKYKSFDMGKSYFWGLTTAIPNVFGGEIHPAHRYSMSPSDWLVKTINPQQASVGQAYGFSVIGESYYNFGIIGVSMIMFGLGRYLMKLSLKTYDGKSKFHDVVACIVFNNLMWGFRNSFYSIARKMLWQYILLVCIILITIIIINKKINFNIK